MTTVTKYLVDDKQLPGTTSGRVYAIVRSLAIKNGDADNGDNLHLFNLRPGHAVIDMQVGNRASLGSSCTLAGRVGTTSITGATTAGSASRVRTSAAPPFDAAAAQEVNLLVGGADITADATVDVVVTIVDCAGAA